MEFYTKVFFVVLAGFVGYLLLLVLQPFAGSMAWAGVRPATTASGL